MSREWEWWEICNKVFQITHCAKPAFPIFLIAMQLFPIVQKLFHPNFIISHRFTSTDQLPQSSASSFCTIWQNKYSQTKPKVFALCLLLVLPLFAFAFVGVFHFTFQLEQEEYVVKTYQYKITNCHISRKLPKIDISAGACWGFCSFFVCFKTRL